MSFLARLFGAEHDGLSAAQQLDLKRLKAVAASLGEKKSALGLKGRDGAEQIHLLNRYLGDRLKSASSRERASMQGRFVAADGVLPKDVSAARSPETTPAMQSVIATGCADLGQAWSPDQVQAVHAHLKTKRVLLCHVPNISDKSVPSLEDVPAGENYATYEFLDLWSSPHLLEMAAQDRFLDLAQAYLGCAPTVYSINAFWSLPNREPPAAIVARTEPSSSAENTSPGFFPAASISRKRNCWRECCPAIKAGAWTWTGCRSGTPPANAGACPRRPAIIAAITPAFAMHCAVHHPIRCPRSRLWQ